MIVWRVRLLLGLSVLMVGALLAHPALAQSAEVPQASSSAPGQPVPQADPGLDEPFSERALQWGTSINRQECASLRHAVWVEHALGTECIRYYPSAMLDAGLEGAAPRHNVAVIFFHGDHLAGGTPLGNYGKITPQSLLDVAQGNERAHKLPYLIVARPGVYGSSGSHRERRRPQEFISLNTAVDVIKQRYGLEQVVLAGQSGGSTAAAALLTLGRTDVKCAAMGSGGYAVNALAAIKARRLGQSPRLGCDGTGNCDAYDVIAHVDGIAADPKRPIYVIGDPQDQNTAFELQQAFHDKLKQAGHEATLMQVQGRGPERHSTTYVAYRVAGLCAREMPVPQVSDQGVSR